MGNVAKEVQTEEEEALSQAFLSPSSSAEQPSAYFVQDQASREELARLCLQDHLLTSAMGGVIPEQKNLEEVRRLLDVGSEPGGWVIEAAHTYPLITSLIGVDISKRMIECTRAAATCHQVSDRVEFAVMDALRMLEFSDRFFFSSCDMRRAKNRINKNGFLTRRSDPLDRHRRDMSRAWPCLDRSKAALHFRPAHMDDSRRKLLLSYCLSLFLASHMPDVWATDR